MRTFFFSFFLLFNVVTFSQNVDLSTYKYIVVASNFDFFKTADEYQTSSLTKFLFQKKGFETFLDSEELPNELKQNRCLSLKATVLDDSNMFTTKNKLQLTDCSGAIIYTSQEGKSKEKEYQKAYHEAIRNAFATMTDFTYSYKPNAVKVSYKIDTVSYEETKKDTLATTTVDKTTLPTYSFVTISNGFQILDNEKTVLFTALKSSVDNIYILKNKNGFMYKKGPVFIAEYLENDTIISATFKAPF